MSSYFSLIPSSVNGSEVLPDGAKLLFGDILGMSNRFGFCFATNNYFARIRSVSIPTIKRWITLLKKHDFIATEYNERNARRIIPNINPMSHEKYAQAQKNRIYNGHDDYIDDVLDGLWKKMK